MMALELVLLSRLLLMKLVEQSSMLPWKLVAPSILQLQKQAELLEEYSLVQEKLLVESSQVEPSRGYLLGQSLVELLVDCSPALVEPSQEYSWEQLLEESLLAELSEEYSLALPRAELPAESSLAWLSGP